MGTAAYWAMAAIQAGGAVDQHNQATKARRLAEENAAKERDALASLQSEAPPAIPTPDDASVRAAKRRSIAGQMRRRGRSSTILTDDTLGA